MITSFPTSAKTKKEPCPECIDQFLATTVRDGGVVMVSHLDCAQALNYREPIGYKNERGVVVLAVVFIALFMALAGMIVGSKAPKLLNGHQTETK